MPRPFTNQRLIVGAGLLLGAWPLESQANVAVVLFTNFVVYSWLLLIPIILIEAYVFKKRLGVSIGRALGISGLANVVSTLVGSIIIFAIDLFPVIPYPAVLTEKPWGAVGDISILIVLIPCYFVSVWVEFLVGAPFLKSVPREDVRVAFYLANAFSYEMLAILPIARVIKGTIVQGGFIW